MERSKRAQRKSTQDSYYAHSPDNQKSPKKDRIIEELTSLTGVKNKKVYTKHGILGKGGFATCYLTKLQGSDSYSAMKVVQKCNIKSNRTRLRLINQIKIHQIFSHPNIVELYHYFEDQNCVYILLQLCQNQSLAEMLKNRKNLTYPQVQCFIYGICNGVKYLHSRKYIHRDLKLGNIFIDKNYQVKIGDFGLAAQLQFIRQNKRTVCGTPNYIAPEVLEGTGYSFQADVWSIGIMVFTLFFGYHPFESYNPSEIYAKIKDCQYYYPKNHRVPREAINLINSILVSDPSKRLTLDQILVSPFMSLGKSFPLKLPEKSFFIEPTSAEIQLMPKCFIQNNQFKLKASSKNDEKMFVEDRSTIDNTLSIDSNVRNDGIDFDIRQKVANTPTPFIEKLKNFPANFISKNLRKSQSKPKLSQQKEKTPDYVVQFEKIQQNLYFFMTTDFVFGTYQKGKQICFRHIYQFDKENNQIHQIRLFNNLFSQIGTIPFDMFQHKTVLLLKVKQYSKAKKYAINLKSCFQKPKPKKLLHVTRINQHKGMFLLRLSNKIIQVKYEDDSKIQFIYDTSSQRIYVSENFEPIRQLQIQKLIQIAKNYFQNSEKLNKVLNKMVQIPFVNQKETIKICMPKVMQIYGIIQQLKTKKGRDNKFRKSQ